MTPESKTVTLKRLCPTRWSSRHDALFALRHRYGDIIKALVKISLTSDKKEERSEASALKNAISKFILIYIYTSCPFDGLQNDIVALRGAEACKPRCCGHLYVVK